jgi:hypothetical protein
VRLISSSCRVRRRHPGTATSGALGHCLVQTASGVSFRRRAGKALNWFDACRLARSRAAAAAEKSRAPSRPAKEVFAVTTRRSAPGEDADKRQARPIAVKVAGVDREGGPRLIHGERLSSPDDRRWNDRLVSTRETTFFFLVTPHYQMLNTWRDRADGSSGQTGPSQ